MLYRSKVRFVSKEVMAKKTSKDAKECATETTGEWHFRKLQPHSRKQSDVK